GNAAKGPVVELPAGFETEITCPSYAGLLDARRSERVYDAKTPMTQKQLAFLLWSVQGVQDIRGANYAAMRPVPSGGARHPFELYFTARNVEGLGQGIYHYLPLEHVGEKRAAVEFIGRLDDYGAAVTEMLAGQKWALNAQIVVFFSCAAYRAEWRYSALAHRVVLIDLGHAGQNLMLSATALGLGSCCMAAFDQAFCDKTLGLDGFEEYTVYACAVGKPRR
ncbi:MAG: SagB/ThcOx family dehydrogenase, partial [Defluviitaleaceae bacterium]|nr:SagB/ThcOx family dehydrogenase [Defluviitaleaceae bacterium]